MRFVLVTTGSLGDVKPFLALALGLQQAGHATSLAGPENARKLCAELGIEFYAIDRDHQERLRAQEGTRLESGNTLRYGLQRVIDKRKILYNVNRAAWKACQGAEAIVYRMGGFLAVDNIAERLRVPCFKAGLVPYTATRKYPSLYVYRGFDLGMAGNRLSYRIGEQVIWQFFREPVNALREKELGLKPYPLTGPNINHFSSRLPVLYGFSPAILPRPDDWPENVHITGHWQLEEDRDWVPPQDLVDFLEDGSPPVYMGFGSMVSRDPQGTYELVLDTLRQCGQRAILASGWGGLGKGDGNSGRIYSLEEAPHAWLFPRVSCVVQHGGIGTLTANLKAGVPAVIVSFNYDQPFWGEVVRRLGVGPPAIPRKRLTAERLAKAICTCLEDAEMQAKAAAIGRQVRVEDGVGCAVQLIQEYIQRGRCFIGEGIAVEG